jgi:excisionase family DNA binding protein
VGGPLKNGLELELFLAFVSNGRYLSQVSQARLIGPETGEGRQPRRRTVTNIDLAHVRLLDINDITDLLKISRSSAYRLVDSGALRSVRIGRFRRVRIEDVVAFVDAHKIPNN